MNKLEGFSRIVTAITWAGIFGWSVFVIIVIIDDGILNIQAAIIIPGVYLAVIFGPRLVFNLVLWIVDGFNSKSGD